MVRDSAGSFIPARHLLTDGEDSNILSLAIRVLKKCCNDGLADWKSWRPRYFLTDDSAAEQLAIKKAFRGMYEMGDEDEVIHLLCQVHSRRALERKVKNEEIRKEIFSAPYYHSTEHAARSAVERALDLAYKVEQRKRPEDKRTAQEMIKGDSKGVRDIFCLTFFLYRF